MAERVPARLTVRKGRDFGLTVGAAFLILAALLWWRAQGSLAAVLTLPTDLRFRHGLSATFALLGAALALAGVALPTRLGGLERAWMYLAHAISKVTTPIFMGVVYFVVVTPIGLGMRLLGRQPLRSAARGATAWISHSKGSSDLERQF